MLGFVYKLQKGYHHHVNISPSAVELQQKKLLCKCLWCICWERGLPDQNSIFLPSIYRFWPFQYIESEDRLLCMYINFIIHSLGRGYLKTDTAPLAIMLQGLHMKANLSGCRRSWEQQAVNRGRSSGSRRRRAVCEGSSAYGGLQRHPVENLHVSTCYKTASSHICVREMNSDPLPCLQF